MPDQVFDIAVIGGGVNGCGIARDAAGRGLSVLLCEKGDIAEATSSASTKLIHGGLRYLEHYEFSLVRKSLIEREVLMAMAPHLISPLRFVLPHQKGLRPFWLIRLGLLLYDYIGGRKVLPASRSVDLTSDEAGRPLKAEFTRAFEYSDCRTDDARLVVLNAIDAQQRGADVRVRTEVMSARRADGIWQLDLKDHLSGETSTASAKVLVNAAGPWVSEMLGQRAGVNTASQVRLVTGSHIVVKQLYEHDRAYIFQNRDGRIVFAIPYLDDYTLIGTTEVDFTGDPGDVEISKTEITYLCDAINEYFKKQIAPDDVVWTFAGVRPLFDDGTSQAAEATRDFVLELNQPEGAAAILSVFGGKLTAYRELAEEVMDKLAGVLEGAGRAWTAGAVLPGGDIGAEGLARFTGRLMAVCPVLEKAHAERLARSYGSRAMMIVDGVKSAVDLGECFGGDLYECEVAYLVNNEWARAADDILWRRSKLGLKLDRKQVQRLEQWLAQFVKSGHK